MDSARIAAIDHLAASWYRLDSPGCAVGVVRGGELVFARGYGSADLEHGVPISRGSVFQLASVSKQFTAAAIAHLVLDGRMRIEDDIREYLPEVPAFGRPITVRHLLLHTSGLGDQWDVLALAGWRAADPKSNHDVLDLVSRQPEPGSPAGEAFAYSNTGYTLLALIVERASGQPFADYTRRALFAPLGMTATHFEDDPADIVPGRARGYVRASGGRYQTAPPTYTVGATGCLSSIADLARWIAELRDGRVFGSAFVQRLMSPGTLDDGTDLAYAYGLFVGTYSGLRSISHAGGEVGYRAFLLWLPEPDLGTVVLANMGTTDVQALGQAVADLYLGREDISISPSGSPQKARKHSPAGPSRLAGTYRDPKSGASLVVRSGDDRLFIEPRLELEPLDNGNFALLTTPVELRFSGGDGALLLLEELFAGHAFARYEAVVPNQVSSEQLSEYVGSYHSDELNTTYGITRTGDRLILRRQRFPEQDLMPTVADQFHEEYGITLFFRRDVEGAVLGFGVSTRLGRQIWFRKLAEAVNVLGA